MAIALGLAVAAWAIPQLLQSFGSEGPTDGGVYREAGGGEMLDLDPLGREHAARDPNLTPLLFRGLVQVAPGGEIHPDLAENWLISRDGLVYTFLLRQGLRWDDGQPLTASDVVFSVRRA